MENIIQAISLYFIGIIFATIVQVTGSLYDSLWRNIKDEKLILSRLILGYATITAVFSIAFFTCKTIFLLATPLILTFFIVTKKVNINLKVPLAKYQLLLFSFLFLFRFISIYDPKNNGFANVYKDDFFYAINISSILYEKNENMIYEIILNKLGYESFKAIYHYFIFNSSVLIKLISNFNSYNIYNFFSLIFFQFLGITGIFLISMQFEKRLFASVLISIFSFSVLRYNGIDDLLITYLKNDHLTNNIFFKNFFGFQLLNSGFSIKISLAIAIVSFYFLFYHEKMLLYGSFFSIWANPLFAFIPLSLGFPLIRESTKRWIHWAVSAFLAFGLLGCYTLLFPGREAGIDLSEALNNSLNILNKGYKFFIFSFLGDFFNEFYNYFLLPIILYALIGKNRMLVVYCIFYLLLPYSNSFCSNTPIWTFFIFIFILLSIYAIYSVRNNSKLLWIVNTFLVFLFLSRFSNIFQEFNQFFIFIFNSFSILITVYLIANLVHRKGYFLIFLFIFLIDSLYQNFKENRFRNIYTALDEKNLSEKISRNYSFKNKTELYGVFNSRMTYQFLNQFLTGEELTMIDDRLIPTPVNIPSLLKSNPKGSGKLKEFFPVFVFSRENKTVDVTRDFILKCKINCVVVPVSDLSRFRKYKYLFSDSLRSGNGKELIFFRN